MRLARGRESRSSRKRARASSASVKNRSSSESSFGGGSGNFRRDRRNMLRQPIVELPSGGLERGVPLNGAPSEAILGNGRWPLLLAPGGQAAAHQAGVDRARDMRVAMALSYTTRASVRSTSNRSVNARRLPPV